eukprot:s1076_g18.t1
MTLGVQKTIQKTSAGGDAKAATNTGPTVIPEDFTVDKDARYTGSVIEFNKWRGFGHIAMDQKDWYSCACHFACLDKVFVHWKNIQTDDRFPRLQQGLSVEFGLIVSQEWRGWNKVRSLKAKTVTLPGGGMVNIQDAMDAESMTFVGAQNFRYTGTVKFFDQFRNFGWVAIDDGFAMDEPVPKEIKVEGEELNTGGKPLRMRIDKLAVEFGIVKSKTGQGDSYMAYNVTLPGGTPITQEALEHRQEEGSQRFTGTVQWWQRWQSWGHIIPDADQAFPATVQEKLEAAAKAKPDGKPAEHLLYFRKDDCEWSLQPQVGKKVSFTVYVDDKGAGAKDVLPVE